MWFRRYSDNKTKVCIELKVHSHPLGNSHLIQESAQKHQSPILSSRSLYEEVINLIKNIDSKNKIRHFSFHYKINVETNKTVLQTSIGYFMRIGCIQFYAMKC